MQRFRAGLACKARRLLYHSTLGSRVIEKKKEEGRSQPVPLTLSLTHSLSLYLSLSLSLSRSLALALSRSLSFNLGARNLSKCVKGARNLFLAQGFGVPSHGDLLLQHQPLDLLHVPHFARLIGGASVNKRLQWFTFRSIDRTMGYAGFVFPEICGKLEPFYRSKQP